MEIIDFMSYNEMNKLIDEADLIITHGGTGSIISPLTKGKKVLACARLKKYEEHVDDHQEEIVNMFADKNYILKIDEDTDLDKLFKQSKKFKQKKYQSNKNNFIKKLKKIID